MENEDVIELLRKKMDGGKTQSDIAHEIDVSVQYISDVLRGSRPPSDKILTYLGLERKIVKVK